MPTTQKDVDESDCSDRSRLRCRDIMTRDVSVATRDMTVRDVALMMLKEDTGIIPVVEHIDATESAASLPPEQATNVRVQAHSNARLVGLITDRDIVVRVVAEGKDTNKTHVEDAMSTVIHAAKEDDRVIDVIRMMGDKQVRRIPVVSDDGNLCGIISMADVVLETEADHELAGALEEISSGASFWNRVFG
jgi:CBS domain-containing protein